MAELELNGVPVYINPDIGPSGTVHAQRLGIALECIVVDSLETFRALEGAAVFRPERRDDIPQTARPARLSGN